ncbi:hypothetical protein [Adlercreutzia sp. ZJ242]|uniref:hypothetical protein n=1 Tax=Adlercreutzia sp. ZJ242 TaxID=2709409 RepID=UPI0013ED3F7C|nr:hypothetical protein [Adlercreutzia sp. ZJ242]
MLDKNKGLERPLARKYAKEGQLLSCKSREDGAYEGAAKAVARAASGGRVINGGDFYTFDTNVLVIIGKDWMPVS